MMKICFHIYLATRSKWAHLTKIIDMPVVPRIGEYVKFKNAEMGDYFGFKVLDITYRESGEIEIMTDLLENIDNRMYSFEDGEASEFDEYYQSFLREGWVCERGVGPNRKYRNS
ncbi:MAG: hypothetical protein KDJ38_08865 [Gammaproteobacteria bacterium]|nr:hypothetical protein [Gammaproteobacteria bacterium]